MRFLLDGPVGWVIVGLVWGASGRAVEASGSLINGMLPTRLSGRDQLLSSIQILGRRVSRDDVRVSRERLHRLHLGDGC